jgi:hypothetical protein
MRWIGDCILIHKSISADMRVPWLDMLHEKSDVHPFFT